MGKRSSNKKLKDELSLETVYIKNMMRTADEYAKKISRHDVPFSERRATQRQDAYLLLLNAAVNYMLNMEKEGIPFPESCSIYKKQLDDFAMDKEIKKGNIPIDRVQTPCKRCEFNVPDDLGNRYCQVWKWRISNERFYTSEDDGCSRGLIKDQYR